MGVCLGGVESARLFGMADIVVPETLPDKHYGTARHCAPPRHPMKKLEYSALPD